MFSISLIKGIRKICSQDCILIPNKQFPNFFDQPNKEYNLLHNK